MKRVGSDTSPLISLETIDGDYKVLRRLYGRGLVPPTVLRELTAGPFKSIEDYIAHFEIEDLLQIEEPEFPGRDETEHLDPGEREAIALAEESDLPLLIEEEADRAVARGFGIRISGIAGQLLRAAREEIFGTPQANRMLADLKRKGRINQQVFESVRRAIDEA